MFNTDGEKPERDIAFRSTHAGSSRDLGRSWTRGTVHQPSSTRNMLATNVWARTSFKPKRRHILNAEGGMHQAEGAFSYAHCSIGPFLPEQCHHRRTLGNG